MKPKKCRNILNGIAGDLIFGFIFLRCPHCKKLLNFRWPSQGICHNCGARLDDYNLKI